MEAENIHDVGSRLGTLARDLSLSSKSKAVFRDLGRQKGKGGLVSKNPTLTSRKLGVLCKIFPPPTIKKMFLRILKTLVFLGLARNCSLLSYAAICTLKAHIIAYHSRMRMYVMNFILFLNCLKSLSYGKFILRMLILLQKGKR